MLGPIYAHLARDPVPRQLLRDNYPRVLDWCERCHGDKAVLEGLADGTWLDEDALPATVLPMLQAQTLTQTLSL